MRLPYFNKLIVVQEKNFVFLYLLLFFTSSSFHFAIFFGRKKSFVYVVGYQIRRVLNMLLTKTVNNKFIVLFSQRLPQVQRKKYDKKIFVFFLLVRVWGSYLNIKLFLCIKWFLFKPFFSIDFIYSSLV